MTHRHGTGAGYLAGCEGCRLARKAYYDANKRRILKRRRESGQDAAGYARQLEAGVQIASRANHHLGMAVLKGPRPEGMTLSLVNPWGESSYWGASHSRTGRKPYRLSTDPSDYVWESQADNRARGLPTQEARPVLDALTTQGDQEP